MSIQFKNVLVFLGLLVVGIVGFFAARGSMLGYLFAHAGAVAITGLLACAAAAIAKSKGYRYGPAFAVTLLLPLFLGALGVCLLYFAQENATTLACGGSVSLAGSVLVVLGYAVWRRKAVPSA